MAELPDCPLGHESVKVVRDGVQKRGGRRRQRYRCVLPDGSYHRFVGAVSHTRGDGEQCHECERPLEVDGGPVAPWRSRYLVKEVAGALWAIAGGASYTDAALRVRRRAWGEDGADRRADTTVASGQTVADWLDRFGPVVAGPFAETEWPETIVLDSTRFMYRDSFTGTTNQLFCVLAAWGYPAGARRGRLWRLRAYPLQDAPTWKQFLAELPGRPELVVIDRDLGAIGGVQARWGRGRNAVPLHLCEHHLYTNGKVALAKGGHTGSDPLQAALAEALSTPEGWQRFYDAALAAGGEPAGWAKHWNKRMLAQTKRRSSIPPALRQRRRGSPTGGGEADPVPTALDVPQRGPDEPAARAGPDPLQPLRRPVRLRRRPAQRAHPAAPPGTGSPGRPSASRPARLNVEPPSLDAEPTRSALPMATSNRTSRPEHPLEPKGQGRTLAVSITDLPAGPHSTEVRPHRQTGRQPTQRALSARRPG